MAEECSSRFCQGFVKVNKRLSASNETAPKLLLIYRDFDKLRKVSWGAGCHRQSGNCLDPRDNIVAALGNPDILPPANEDDAPDHN